LLIELCEVLYEGSFQVQGKENEDMTWSMDKAQAWGCPCHPNKYPRGTSVKACGCPEAPLLHRQKLGHLSRHYIFIASYTMHFSWSVFTFAFSFLLFFCYNKWLDTNKFLLEKMHSFFIAKNTLVFTLTFNECSLFLVLRLAFIFHLDFCSDLVISLYQGAFRPLVYNGFHL
jgi:hypothetical protein